MRLTPIRKPRTFRFRGINPITPDVVGYYRGTLGGQAVHVELSKERPPYFSQTVSRDPNGGPLWGTTILRPDGLHLEPDPSRCHHSEAEAREYLAAL